MFRKWFLIPWPSPGQSNGNVMMLCCCQNRRSKNALLPTFLPSLTEVSRWTVMRARRACLCTNWELHWKIEDWDTLDRHYGVIIVTIITENYRLRLIALDTFLVTAETREMKPDPVHWAEDPPGSLSGWITNAQIKISRQFWTPWDLLGCNDIWALVTNSGEVKYNMNALATANTGERGMAVNW